MHGRADRLSKQMGVEPLFISCWCGLVQQLDLWVGNSLFTDLVDTADGHRKIICCANKYRKATNYWPSPAWVFEKLLGPPTPLGR